MSGDREAGILRLTRRPRAVSLRRLPMVLACAIGVLGFHVDVRAAAAAPAPAPAQNPTISESAIGEAIEPPGNDRLTAFVAVSFTDVSSEAGLFESPWPIIEGGGNAIDPPGGLAVDINEDGWTDIFVPLEVGDTPDRLYINNGDGTFTESAAAWGIADTNLTHSALFFDYDNDGMLDLVLGNQLPTSENVLRLFHRRPNEEFFDDVTAGSGMDFTWPSAGEPAGMAAGDLNDDGYLDLIVSTWTYTWTGTDLCLRNQQNGTFVDDREALGIPAGNSNTWQAQFADFDLDGRIDLFLAEDSAAVSRLCMNMAPWDVHIVNSLVGISLATDMGVSVGDFDNDGDFDLTVTDWAAGSASCPYPGPYNPNRFFRNELIPSGTLTFTDIRTQTGTGLSGVGWGCTFVDYDNDSWQDLAVASSSCNQRMFHNLGDGISFDPVGPAVGFDVLGVAGGLMALDYDRDGDRDLLLISRDVSPRLYRNDGGNANHWLVVDPVYAVGNRDRQAIGAQVRVTVGGMTLLRQISAGTSFKSQEPDEAHFGLAAATQAQNVHILWPDGSWQQHADVGADQFVTYTRVQGDFDWDGQVTGIDVATFISVLLGETTTSNELLRADMNFDDAVDTLDVAPFISALLAGS